MSPTLRTVRLVMEPYVAADEHDFWLLFDDPRVTRWLGPSDVPHDDRFRRVFTAPDGSPRRDVWAVREHGSYVGHAEVTPAAHLSGPEVRYALRPDVWGRGLGREIVEAVTAYALEVRGYDVLHAAVDARNAASLAVLARAGYVHTGDIAAGDGTLTRVLSRESSRAHAPLR